MKYIISILISLLVQTSFAQQFVTTGATQTLTNKTIASPIITGTINATTLNDNTGVDKMVVSNNGVLNKLPIPTAGSSSNNTIAELRTFTAPSAALRYYTTNLGQEGFWYHDAADITSTDNTGTILVSSNGKRFKRVYDGSTVNAKWFGAKGDATTDNLAAFNLAVAAAPTGGTIFIPGGTYMLSGTLAITGNKKIQGDGLNATVINPTAAFAVGADFITFTGGYSAIRDIASGMLRRAGNWVTFIGEGAGNWVERCVVSGVKANYWAIEFRDVAGPNGAAINNVIGNVFSDFDGGGIFGNGGGDSNNFLANVFQLVNSQSHILKWNGIAGAANLVFDKNNATGASKFIELNIALEFKITNNQFEQVNNNNNATDAMIVVNGASLGSTISHNNINGSDSASVGIYLNDVQRMDIQNNTITGVTTSIQTTALTTDVTFIKGTTTGTFNDATGAISTIDGGTNNTSTFKGKLTTNGYVPSADFGAAYLTGLSAGYHTASVDKGVNIGYNNTTDQGFIGVVHNSTGWKPLSLQPVSGNVIIGSQTDNANKLQVVGNASVTGILKTVGLTMDNTGDKNLLFTTSGLSRWGNIVAGNETGGNVGSDYIINSYNDAGAYLTSPFIITRATGTSTFNGIVNGVTASTADNSIKMATTAFVKNQGYGIDANVVHLTGAESITGLKTLSTTRTSGADAVALVLTDNVTGVQGVGFGNVIKWQSNATGTEAQIKFLVGGSGTNNESAIGLYTQNTFGGLTERLNVGSLGKLKASGYGVGSFPGTAAYNLSVDASGNIIEGPINGTYVGTQYITAGTVYTSSAGVTKIKIRAVGGGGGGGGAIAGTSTTLATGSGGSAGGYLEKVATVTSATAYTIAIGAGGIGVSGSAGLNGDATTILISGTTYTATGGTGGTGAGTADVTLLPLAGVIGGLPTNGDINIRGGGSGHSLRLSGISAISGKGGDSHLGAGGISITTTATGSTNGNAGAAHGAGGSGGVSGATAATGGAGSAGILIIDEYK